MSHKVKILHFSTHNENCGIGKYQEMFLEAMQDNATIYNKFFETSPNQLRSMSATGKQEVYKALRTELSDYDILHIQHEFSFLYNEDFPAICQAAKELGKKLIVTIHTSPGLVFERPALPGLHPRSMIHYLRQSKRGLSFEKIFTAPMRDADMVLVHNSITREALADIGIKKDRIKTIILPVPELDHKQRSGTITKKLNKQPGDVVMATTGFLHKFKGIDHAIKALTFLPPNYKLAIIGGMHPDHDHKVYNEVADLIHELGLQERVYITGFIKDDGLLNAMVRECDICVYPYDRKYYSNISSASLNNGFANHKAVIAYPTESFIELNKKVDAMILCGAFAYYELAREVRRVDLETAAQKAKKFAQTYSYKVVAEELIDLYRLCVRN